MTRPKVCGGTCAIFPVQICLVWSAYQAETISWLALKVWFALWIIKSSRCKQIKEGTPYQYHISELYRYFKRVSKKALDEALRELEAVNLVKFTESDIWFAERFEDLINDQVRDYAEEMFNQLHPNTRDKRMSFPRRLLKLIIKSGKKIVRVATLLGLLLRIMLTKFYDAYKGCVKASWIADLFGVSRHRVNAERSKLIEEEIFTRISTSQRVKNRYGEWIALNLGIAESTPPEENTTETSPKLVPPEPENPPKLVPLINQFLSPNGEIQENQILTPEAPGVLQSEIPKKPTWTNITIQDLQDFERSEQLRQEALDQGLLRDTIPDREKFFAAVAHALRVATTNACGMLRTIVEKGLWNFLSLVDEYNGIRRLRSHTDTSDRAVTVLEGVLERGNETDQTSRDAKMVEILTADLEKVGVTSDAFRIVQRYGYLQDWTEDRWMNAELELTQERLLGRRA